MGMILDQARQYVERGWSVIPLGANSKRPVVEWEEYQQRKPTETELETWFSDDTNNIGIVTGPVSKLFVVDVDDYKGNDHKPYPTPLVAKTANGGKHYFYDYSEEVHNKQGVLPNVDVRGDGGYVVAYPSKLVDDNTGEVKEYSWQQEGTPAVMPSEVLSKYKGTVKDASTPAPISDDALALLTQVLTKGFTPGQHNEELHTLARLMARSTHNPDLGYKVTETMLATLDSLDDTPQAAENQLLPTLKSGWDYEQSRLEKPIDNSQFETITREIAPASLKEMRGYKPPAVLFEDGQIIREGTLVVVVGQRNNGKTLFLQHVALGTAANGKRVAYVLTEDSPYFFARRAEQWENEHDTHIDEELFKPWRAKKGLIWQLTSMEDVAEMVIQLKPHKPDLLILDPLIEFALGADEQSAQTMGLIMSHLQFIKRELNCTVVIAHHAGKDLTRGARGSSAIEGSADTVITIRQNKISEDVTAFCTKERNGSKPPSCVYKVTTSDDGMGAALSRAGSIEEAVLASNTSDNRILQALLQANEPLTKQEIADASGVSVSTVYRRLTVLLEDGRIIEVEAENKYAYNFEEAEYGTE